MGLHFLGVFRIALLDRTARVGVTQKPAGLLGAFVIRLAFGFGWSPCVGPVLAAFLVLAGVLVFTGQMPTIANWLIETFPALGTIG